MNQFPAKAPGESFVLEIDFAKYVTSLTTATAYIETYQGVDVSPEDVLSGSAQITGTKVRQRVVGGVSGVIYYLRFTVSDSVDTWVHEHLLPVQERV